MFNITYYPSVKTLVISRPLFLKLFMRMCILPLLGVFAWIWSQVAELDSHTKPWIYQTMSASLGRQGCILAVFFRSVCTCSLLLSIPRNLHTPLLWQTSVLASPASPPNTIFQRMPNTTQIVAISLNCQGDGWWHIHTFFSQEYKPEFCWCFNHRQILGIIQ